eukprot:6462459-Amphidinium_carterae.1
MSDAFGVKAVSDKIVTSSWKCSQQQQQQQQQQQPECRPINFTKPMQFALHVACWQYCHHVIAAAATNFYAWAA